MKCNFLITWTAEIWLWIHVHCQRSLKWAGTSSAKVCIFQPRVELWVWRENTGVKFWRHEATAATCSCPFYCWTPWISEHIQIVCRLKGPSKFQAIHKQKKMWQMKDWFPEDLLATRWLRNRQDHGWCREFSRTPMQVSWIQGYEWRITSAYAQPPRVVNMHSVLVIRSVDASVSFISSLSILTDVLVIKFSQGIIASSLIMPTSVIEVIRKNPSQLFL